MIARHRRIRAMFAAQGSLLVAMAAAQLAGCPAPGATPDAVFTTRQGLGPDKWASAWLLTRHVDPEAQLRVVAPGQPLPQGIPFDVDGAVYQRRGTRSTFEVILDEHAVSDPDIRALADIVHSIEVNFWSTPTNAHARIVEDGFRRLQQHYGREGVVPDCYLAYFDRVYQYLRAKRLHAPGGEEDSLEIDCRSLGPGDTRTSLVRELPIDELLGELGRGGRIVFVDVREPEEFAERHIPGAINLALRDAEPASVQGLAGADFVVSYCVKDFRGFEMARTLQELGIENSVILKPYGISGWMASGLPVAGSRALREATATHELAACARDPDSCLRP